MEVFQFILVVLELLVLSKNRAEGKCRRIKYPKFADDKEPANHPIAVWDVNDLWMCMANCFHETEGCVSFSLCTTPYEWKECKLYSSSAFSRKSPLVEKKGCEFYTSESTCSSSPCLNNAVCIPHMPWDRVPHTCICPAGFTGQVCEIKLVSESSKMVSESLKKVEQAREKASVKGFDITIKLQ